MNPETEVLIKNDKDQKIPTEWVKVEQIETWIGKADNGENKPEELGGRSQLIVLHRCGNDKGALIGQLKTMISGLETNFDWFAK